MRTAQACGRADIASLGAAMAYYALFSLTPLLLLAASILGWVLTPADAAALVRSSFVQMLPAGSSGEAVATALANLALTPNSDNALSALFGLGALIFTASGMFGSLN